MKIAITSTGNTLESPIDSRFGRASGFVIYDTDTKRIDYLDNDQVLDSSSGAGIQAARNIVDSGISVLLTGHCGPKAFKALKAADVEIYTGIRGTIQQTIDDFKNNKLELAQSADVEGHWT